jgi:hypothetical protein
MKGSGSRGAQSASASKVLEHEPLFGLVVKLSVTEESVGAPLIY